MRIQDLATQSPATIVAARVAFGIDALQNENTAQDTRLQAVETAIATIPSGPTLALTPNVANVTEDIPAVGNILANDTTTIGVLRVLEYWIAGRVGSIAAGVRTDIPSVGSFIVYADGEWGFTPVKNYNGVVPVISFQITNGSEIRISSLTITMNAVDDPPVANTSSTMTAINEPVVLQLLNGDYDPEGAVVTLTHLNAIPVVVGTPIAVPNGTAVIGNNNTLTFTPTADFEGQSNFPYTISDGTLSTDGAVNIQVGYENIPLFSPVSLIAAGDYFDEANVNFGNTAMSRVGELYNNGVNVTDATYTTAQGKVDLTTREPWLYDRATTIYKLYLRTKDPTILAKALEYADLYFAGVVQTFDNADFVTGGGAAADVKYMYPVIAWWYERETGDGQYRTKARGLYNLALASFSSSYSSGAALWTERNTNYAMQACLAQYWLSGDQVALGHAEQYFEMLLSMSTASGAPLHPHSQHEGSGITTQITSPWMGALIVETLIQLYRTNSDERIVQWIARYCDFVVERGFYVNNVVPEFLGLRIPAYLVGLLVQYPDADGASGDSEHCFDIGHMLLKGVWAKRRLGQSTTLMQGLATEQFVVARHVMNDWTRTTQGYPRYRVNPPRKIGWWFGGAYSKIYYAGQVPLGPISQTLPTISGSTAVGSTLTVTPGTYAGDPAPTLTYQWTHNAVIIPDETGTTYITLESDIGAEISVVETATNVGGTISRNPLLTIVPVAAGSPTITTQPTDAIVAADADAIFTVVATGIPEPTYQWLSMPSGTPISGATSAQLTRSNVQTVDSGDRFACDITNSSGTIRTNTVALYVAGQIQAVQFTTAQNAQLQSSILAAGAANFTVEALVRIDGARLGNRALLTNRYIAGRIASIGTADNWPDYGIAILDSQTGYGVALSIDPVQGDWYHMSISGDEVLVGGLFRSTLQALTEGAVQASTTRAKGFTELLNHVGFEVNGGSGSNGLGLASFQYVRAYATQRSLAAMAANRASADMTDALFWWVFEDDGAGGVTVRDATGNGRVPTLTGGTLVTGPIVPVI